MRRDRINMRLSERLLCFAGLAAATLLLVTSCSPSSVREEGVIAFVQPEPSGLQERLNGVLLLDSSGCLVVEVEGDRLLVAWPNDVRVEVKSGDTTVVTHGRSYRVGDEVEIPGGEDPNGQATIDAKAPDECQTASRVYLVNSLG
jgi:hypothetical protein